jgi:UDP-N-acetylglucosamine--N-acetylmuramyl-(pentapeptide) pyrophosphoryl-undecaprenol N-acetylglucosamine transferase
VYPLLTVAQALEEECSDVGILYVGHAEGLEASIVARTDLPFRGVEAGPIRGTTPLSLAKSLRQLWRGFRQARALLSEWRADVVATTGSYVSAPVALAAWRARVPVLVYLPDLAPGLAVRLQARFADQVAVSFEEVRRHFPPGKVWVSGYPVRSQIGQMSRASGIEILGLSPERKTLLGFGGSRGARSVNRALLAILPDLLSNYQVIHITGQLDWPEVSERQAALGPEMQSWYHAYPYLHGEQLAAALAASDLVVARAGAATMAEFPAVGLPSVLVPYPYSGQHQQANADFMVSRGAAVSIDDAALSEQLKPTVLRLLSDERVLREMSARARALARPDAARELARALVRLASPVGEVAYDTAS